MLKMKKEKERKQWVSGREGKGRVGSEQIKIMKSTDEYFVPHCGSTFTANFICCYESHKKNHNQIRPGKITSYKIFIFYNKSK
jgi:hypothetical protein